MIAPSEPNKPKRRRRSAKQLRQEAFLAAYVACGTISHAAKAAGVDRKRHYHWLEEDDYAAAFEVAQVECLELLEHEARRRSVHGVPRMKFYKGEPVMVPALDGSGNPIKDANGELVLVPYVEYEYSDTLTVLLLKSLSPEKYRERTEQRLTGDTNATIQIVHDDDWYGNAERLNALNDGVSDALPSPQSDETL